MGKVLILLLAVLCVSNAWTNTPTMIIARIAQKDLEANGNIYFVITLPTFLNVALVLLYLYVSGENILVYNLPIFLKILADIIKV